MLRRMALLALAVVSVALTALPAAADQGTARRGPLLVEAEAGTPVVEIDPDNPLSATFDLHLLVENVSKKKDILIASISGELEFSDGSTTPFELPADFVLEPGFGSVFFALLIVPLDAPSGEAVARVEVEYQVEGQRQTKTVEVEVDFEVIQQ